MYLTSSKTVKDWERLRGTLQESNDELLWRKAFIDFFWGRVQSRYLDPIQSLKRNDNYVGYGFAIMTLLCSLIEFLESCYEGKNYRCCDNAQLQPYEYNRSKQCFIEFLSTKSPFAEKFTRAEALEFYSSVRCGLLHEASTKDGWRIWARSKSAGDIVCTQTKTVYRDGFEAAIKSYIKAYGEELACSKVLQNAFIRKFDALCR